MPPRQRAQQQALNYNDVRYLKKTDGVTGPRGVVGPSGITGISIPGFTGLRGVTGIQGGTGVSGTTGLANFVESNSWPTPLITPSLLWNEQDEALYLQADNLTHLVQISSGSLQGATGYSGYTGLQGNTGIQGLGINGETGLQGETGLGTTGLQGETGLGTTGNTGIQGQTGMFGGVVGDFTVDGTFTLKSGDATANFYMTEGEGTSLVITGQGDIEIGSHFTADSVSSNTYIDAANNITTYGGDIIVYPGHMVTTLSNFGFKFDNTAVTMPNGALGIGSGIISPDFKLSVSTGAAGKQAIFGQDVAAGQVGIVIGEQDANYKSGNIIYDNDDHYLRLTTGGNSKGVNVDVSGTTIIGDYETLPPGWWSPGFNGQLYVNGYAHVNNDLNVTGYLTVGAGYGIHSNGNITANGDVTAAGDMYATNLYATHTHYGDMTVAAGSISRTAAATLVFGTSGSTRWYIGANGILLPSADLAHDFGASSQRINNIHAQSLHASDATIAAVGGSITFSGAVTISSGTVSVPTGIATGGTAYVKTKTYTQTVSPTDEGNQYTDISVSVTNTKVRGISAVLYITGSGNVYRITNVTLLGSSLRIDYSDIGGFSGDTVSATITEDA